MDKRNWETVNKLEQKNYNWQMQYANKRNRKKRAIGGIVIAVRMGIK